MLQEDAALQAFIEQISEHALFGKFQKLLRGRMRDTLREQSPDVGMGFSTAEACKGEPLADLGAADRPPGANAAGPVQGDKRPAEDFTAHDVRKLWSQLQTEGQQAMPQQELLAAINEMHKSKCRKVEARDLGR